MQKITDYLIHAVVIAMLLASMFTAIPSGIVTTVVMLYIIFAGLGLWGMVSLSHKNDYSIAKRTNGIQFTVMCLIGVIEASLLAAAGFYVGFAVIIVYTVSYIFWMDTGWKQK